MKTPTPELDKQHAVIKSGASDTLTEFIDWFQDEKGYVLCKWGRGDNEFIPVGTPINSLFAEFFGIDLDKIESERRAILEELRSA